MPPEDQDEGNRFSQWEYAGNRPPSADPLKHLVESWDALPHLDGRP